MGKDARLIYKFPQEKKIPKQMADGNIDYYDFDIVQNTKAGDILVSKIPPQPGKKGINIFGEEITGKDAPN